MSGQSNQTLLTDWNHFTVTDPLTLTNNSLAQDIFQFVTSTTTDDAIDSITAKVLTITQVYLSLALQTQICP